MSTAPRIRVANRSAALDLVIAVEVMAIGLAAGGGHRRNDTAFLAEEPVP